MVDHNPYSHPVRPTSIIFGSVVFQFSHGRHQTNTCTCFAQQLNISRYLFSHTFRSDGRLEALATNRRPLDWTSTLVSTMFVRHRTRQSTSECKKRCKFLLYKNDVTALVGYAEMMMMRGCGYNKNCVLYPRTWVDGIILCRFIRAMDDEL